MTMCRRWWTTLLLATFAFDALGSIASAQKWPTRPVTMVIPFAAGSGVDVLGRILAPPLSEILGQPVVVENVTGAGGMVGTAWVAKATPDGYQFVLGNVGTHAQNQALHKTPLYNAATDFAPVVLIAEQPIVLITRKDFPAHNLEGFIAYGKAHQAKLQFGSAGVGSAAHLACVMLNAAAGIEAAHVPYRGGAEAMQDLMAGRIDYQCPFMAIAISQIESKFVQAIASWSGMRSRYCLISPPPRNKTSLALTSAPGSDSFSERHANSNRQQSARCYCRGNGNAYRQCAVEISRRRAGLA